MNWWYVYVLQNKNNEIYVGSTNDLEVRLKNHNSGFCKSTKFGIPWEIILSVAVKTEKKARALEKYFKTGSGKAILKKRFL